MTNLTEEQLAYIVATVVAPLPKLGAQVYCFHIVRTIWPSGVLIPADGIQGGGGTLRVIVDVTDPDLIQT